MFDFDGWRTNWDWSGNLTSDAPRWLRRAAIPAAVLGVLALAAGWLELPVAWSAWMLLAGAGVTIEALGARLFGLDNLIIPWAHALLLAGMLAFVASFMPGSEARRAFGVIAPCLAIGSAPLLTRIWAATLFASDMIAFAEERIEVTRAALAGESDALVARVEKLDRGEVELVTVGGRGEQRLIASTEIVPRRSCLSVGSHVLIEQPQLGDPESPDGYRASPHLRRVRAVGNSRWLGNDPRGMPASVYADEARAGVVMMALHHLAVVGVSLAIAYA